MMNMDTEAQSAGPPEPERWPLSLCYLYTAGGVGELYQRRSTLL